MTQGPAIPIAKLELEQVYSIYTSLSVYKSNPRVVTFVHLLLIISLCYFGGKYIGENEMSLALAFYLAILIYLVALVLIALYSVILSKSILNLLQPEYTKEEVSDFDSIEASIMDTEFLESNIFFVFYAFDRRYAKNKRIRKSNSEKSKKNDALAILFIIFFLLTVLGWHIYSAPRRFTKIIHGWKSQGTGIFIRRLFSQSLVLIPIIFFITIFVASWYGALALDFTK